MHLICLVLLAGVVLVSPILAAAKKGQVPLLQEKQMSDLELGRNHYLKGDYEEALQHLSRAAKADPDNAAIQYQIGLTYQDMSHYSEARHSFSRAVEMKPLMGDGWSHLGDMDYRLGDFVQAREALEKAERMGQKGEKLAYILYLKGMVLMDLASFDEAVKALQKSQELAANYAQMASYAIGIIYNRKGKQQAAEHAWKKSVAMNSESVTGVYASIALQQLHKQQPRRWHMNLAYNIQYDDNVILNPGGVAASLLPSDQKDFVHEMNLHGDYQYKINGKTSITSSFNYYKSLHQKISNLDVDGLSVALGSSYSGLPLGELMLEAGADVYWVGHKDYLYTLSISPSWGIKLGKHQSGMLSGQGRIKQYANQTLINVADNRDALNYSLAYMHYIYTNNKKGYVNLGYTYDVEQAKGYDWGYDGHRFSALAHYSIWNEYSIHLNSDYYVQNYKHLQTLFVRKRNDRILTLSAILKANWKWVTTNIHYTHVRAKSSISLYQYRRSVVGAGFEFNY